MKHILSARQFTLKDLETLFESADQMEALVQKQVIPTRKNNNGIALLFFQPSTRTHSSFVHAANCLGIPVWYSPPDVSIFSSAAKGESLGDTLRIFCNYPYIKVIVLRHPHDYSAEVASTVTDRFGISIINAGDGTNEHPTQALLDLYTMKRATLKPLNQVRLVVANDIDTSRTIRSLLILFVRNFQPTEIGICAPSGINLPLDLHDELVREGGVEIRTFRNIGDALCWSDFLYMTRPQIESVAKDIEDEEKKKELIEERRKLFANFRITAELLEKIPDDCPCQLMHPMPVDRRDFNEIDEEASVHPRSIIYKQAQNGLYMRMGILSKLIPNTPTSTN